MSYLMIVILTQEILDWPSPPGEIYHMRYVNAGVCIVGKGVDLKHLDGVPPDRAFIIEELITPLEGGKFVKWIHNADPKSAVPAGHPEYAKAQFLSALQYLQYEKTHRNAYVSDSQGCSLFLTDGQIMTSPSLVEGSLTVLFGDGNVPDAFQSFAGKHACNDWCDWIGLSPFRLLQNVEKQRNRLMERVTQAFDMPPTTSSRGDKGPKRDKDNGNQITNNQSQSEVDRKDREGESLDTRNSPEDRSKDDVTHAGSGRGGTASGTDIVDSG
ncbi:hypothetical protein K435DRAFT_863887 [Dendrothele bispora CBS 962.96]|uniref:Alpha-type protein kinase domain-containing protein n=1 Tax=Dendrothele bispora (strain CBS 962.96) TaxID=1314807 RepID=A0A4S8LNQ0_DENBC|nr:hypothetical protein K435DRAFT_863887 [Dendrothele bispora CBS 962.96]